MRRTKRQNENWFRGPWKGQASNLRRRILRPREHSGRPGCTRERGQAAVFLVLALGIFLIGGVGFVVDGSNLWFHRQYAQTAADAACTAGAMDLLSNAAGVTPPATAWIPASDDGSGFDCSATTDSNANSSFPPCSYARLNGYSGTGSNDVQVSFPTLSIAAACPTLPPFSLTACAADGVASTPYMRVDVSDNVPTTFMRLLGAGPKSTVPARATCGLSNVLSPLPVLVLNPNAAGTMSGSGFNFSVAFTTPAAKTPTKLIQVNSSDAGAVSASGTVNLSNADGSQGNFTVAGRQAAPGIGGAYTWVNAGGIIPDPFAAIQPPTPGSLPAGSSDSACPAGLGISSSGCRHYHPGYWGAGITVGNPAGSGNPVIAVFEPGVYYLDGNFTVFGDTCLRPDTSAGTSGGTVFYFHGTSTLSVSAASGTATSGGFNCLTSPVALADIQCTARANPLLTGLPVGGVTGNVLLGPCEASVGDPLQPYGDPLGSGDPATEQRGMLFFQDRDSTATPAWSSSSSFALIGNIYFHHCGSGSGSGANCSSRAFDDTFNLGGPTGYIVGDIVVDQLAINSGSSIKVSLNPNPEYYVLKVSLVQ